MDLFKTEWLKAIGQGLVISALVVVAVAVAMVTFAAAVWAVVAMLR